MDTTKITEADFDAAINVAAELLPKLKAAIIIGVTDEGQTIAFAGGDKELLTAALVYSHIKKGQFVEMFLRIHNTQSDLARHVLDMANDRNLMGKVNALMDLMAVADRIKNKS
jgi:hypothetical protein